MKYDIVAAGHICLDVCPAFEAGQAQDIGMLFRPGKIINMNGITVSAGGPVSNTGFAMASRRNGRPPAMPERQPHVVFSRVVAAGYRPHHTARSG